MAAIMQMMMAGGIILPVNLSFITTPGGGITSGTYTVPSKRCMVLLTWGAQTSPVNDPTSVMISGHAATKIVGGASASIWAAMVDPGDPNTWSVTCPNIFSSRCLAGLFKSDASRINATSINNSGTLSPTLNVPEGGSILGTIHFQHAAATSSTSWTLLSEDYDASGNQHTYSAAHKNYTAAAALQNPTVTPLNSAGSGEVWAVLAP